MTEAATLREGAVGLLRVEHKVLDHSRHPFALHTAHVAVGERRAWLGLGVGLGLGPGLGFGSGLRVGVGVGLRVGVGVEVGVGVGVVSYLLLHVMEMMN